MALTGVMGTVLASQLRPGLRVTLRPLQSPPVTWSGLVSCHRPLASAWAFRTHSRVCFSFFLSIFFSSCLSCVFSQNSYGNGVFSCPPHPVPLSVRFPVLQTRFESRPRAGGKQSLRGLLTASKCLGHPRLPGPPLSHAWPSGQLAGECQAPNLEEAALKGRR